MCVTYKFVLEPFAKLYDRAIDLSFAIKIYRKRRIKVLKKLLEVLAIHNGKT